MNAIAAALLPASLALAPVAPDAASSSFSPWEDHFKHDRPWVAAALSGGVSLEMMAVGSVLAANPSTAGPLSNTLLLTAPLTAGLGQFYAGDATRGALVTLGAPLAQLAGFLAGWAVGKAILPQGMAGGLPPESRGSFFSLLYLVPLAYGAWSAWDAYTLTERKNQQTP